jgi:hypothetical protein
MIADRARAVRATAEATVTDVIAAADNRLRY